jgi:hypothetical protein
MNKPTSGKFSKGSLALATVLLGGVMFAGSAQAADRDDGRFDRETRYTARRAHQAEERFGYNSREARHWRHENREARQRAERYEHRDRDRHRRDHDRDWR